MHSSHRSKDFLASKRTSNQNLELFPGNPKTNHACVTCVVNSVQEQQHDVNPCSHDEGMMLHLIHWEPSNVFSKMTPKKFLGRFAKLHNLNYPVCWIKRNPQNITTIILSMYLNLQPRPSLTQSNSCHLQRFRKHTPRWLKFLHDIFRTSKPSIVENSTVQKTLQCLARVL